MSWRAVLISVPLTKCRSRLGHAIAPVVSCQLLTTGAQVRTQGSPCGILGDKVALGWPLLNVLWFSPVSIISLLLHIHSCIIKWILNPLLKYSSGQYHRLCSLCGL
jgi:hypothetical protein